MGSVLSVEAPRSTKSGNQATSGKSTAAIASAGWSRVAGGRSGASLCSGPLRRGGALAIPAQRLLDGGPQRRRGAPPDQPLEESHGRIERLEIARAVGTSPEQERRRAGIDPRDLPHELHDVAHLPR